MKKILFYIIITAIIVGFYLITRTDKTKDIVVLPKIPTGLCFYKEIPIQNGLYDVSFLKMKILDDKVTGEFRNIPAEKDSKVGVFEGDVGEVDPNMMARTADVWWDSFSEGMRVTEQLKIVFGEGTADVGFSEMVDRGDGIYIYKEPENIAYWLTLSDVSCGDLDDRTIVEDYIRNNIESIAPEEPVIGGSFYVISVHLDTFSKTGVIVYEDGHIQGTATFSYIVESNSVSLFDIQKSN